MESNTHFIQYGNKFLYFHLNLHFVTITFIHFSWKSYNSINSWIVFHYLTKHGYKQSINLHYMYIYFLHLIQRLISEFRCNFTMHLVVRMLVIKMLLNLSCCQRKYNTQHFWLYVPDNPDNQHTIVWTSALPNSVGQLT